MRRIREIERNYQISISNNENDLKFGGRATFKSQGAVGHSKNLSKAGLQIFQNSLEEET